MRLINTIIGALVEAWGEVKVQKARVILSLVGVTAAVAAMATVIALGDLMVQSQRETQEAYSGREVVLNLAPQKTSADGSVDSSAIWGCSGDGCAALSSSADSEASTDDSDGSDGWSSEATGSVNDPVGAAMITVAQRFDIPYWSRVEQAYDVQIRELNEVNTNSTFQGMPVTVPENSMGSGASLIALDPSYQVLYRIDPIQGRWIESGDVNQRVTPVVINSVMWEMFGKPDISQPVVLTLTNPADQQVKIVGVTAASSQWDSPTMYMPYDSWQLMKTNEMQQNASQTAVVWVDPDEADEARTVLPAAMKAVLGDGWSVDVFGGEYWDAGEDALATMKLAVMAIGGVVIFLGALGLLNVAIVTVRQRIREIGIRRAMGASAGRVFFSVFMESVVATFVAGIIGVGIAIVLLRVLPLDTWGIVLQDTPAFPMNAAIAGIGIATAVGALCGVIPAIAAVKVKPIDAIRY